ncbi:hypothetical protein M434DRAFT_13364 [Hypoxylon sp. CO27-5]|nr:hypothetical protein M434DRAFT_13364 [Hypoxylon sp. CO27-5]
MAQYGPYPMHGLASYPGPFMSKIPLGQEILNSGENINRLHPKKGTALHIAVKGLELYNPYGNSISYFDGLKFLKWMLDNGADPRLRNRDGGRSSIDEAVLCVEEQKKLDAPFHFFEDARILMIVAAKHLEGNYCAYFPYRKPEWNNQLGNIDREAAEKRKQPMIYRFFCWILDFFGIGRDTNDDKCALCRCLPERKANPPKSCEACKEEKAYYWHYNPVGLRGQLPCDEVDEVD